MALKFKRQLKRKILVRGRARRIRWRRNNLQAYSMAGQYRVSKCVAARSVSVGRIKSGVNREAKTQH